MSKQPETVHYVLTVEAGIVLIILIQTRVESNDDQTVDKTKSLQCQLVSTFTTAKLSINSCNQCNTKLESSQVLDYAEFVTCGECGVECHDEFPEIYFLHFNTKMQPRRKAKFYLETFLFFKLTSIHFSNILTKYIS